MLISIVVPTFQRPSSVCEILDGLRDVDSSSITLTIVVDKGAEQYQHEYHSISALQSKKNISFIFAEKNMGGPWCRNTGYRSNEDADWVWFLDDDDVLAPQCVVDVVNRLKRGPIVEQMLVLPARVEHSGSTVLRKQEGEDLNSRLRRFGNNVNTSCWLFRRELLDKVHGWDEALVAGQDTDLLLRCSVYSDACQLDATPVTVRHHSDYRVTNDWKRQLKGKLQFLRKNWSLLSWRRRGYYVITLVTVWPLSRRVMMWRSILSSSSTGP